MNNRFLNDEEMTTLTGYKRPAEQRHALDLMKVRYLVRPTDGKPIVLKDALLPSQTHKKKAPAWERVA